MIVEFTIKNYRSFKSKFTLSMEAEGLRTNTHKLIKAPHGSDLLPSAGIFGGNASGKSNIFKALQLMAWAMQNSDYIKRPTTKHPLLAPFRLDDDSAEQPTLMEIVIWDPEEEKEYSYGFEIDAREILKEYLNVKSKVNKNFTDPRIFTRDKQQFEFDPKHGTEMSKLQDRVRPDALALSVFAQFNEQLSSRLVGLVGDEALYIVRDNVSSMYDALRECDENESLLNEVTELVLQADLSIEKITIKQQNAFDKFGPSADSDLAKSIRRDMHFTIREALTRHKKYGKSAESDHAIFDLVKDESAGTGRFFALATHIVRILKTGGVLVVDDLDASLHPLMSKAIVEQFDNKETNPNGAQLIYNSHEIFLMSEEVNLRRDQIWLTEKNDTEETELIRLSDYKVRDDYRIDRNYLVGRFGGIPSLQFDEPNDEE